MRNVIVSIVISMFFLTNMAFSDIVWDKYSLALKYFQSEKYKEALDFLQKTRNDDDVFSPNYPYLSFIEARILLSIGKTAEAREKFIEAYNFGRRYNKWDVAIASLYWLGILHIQLQENTKALKYLTLAYRYGTPEIQQNSLYWIFRIYISMGETSKAQKILEVFKKNFPENPNIHYMEKLIENYHPIEPPKKPLYSIQTNTNEITNDTQQQTLETQKLETSIQNVTNTKIAIPKQFIEIMTQLSNKLVELSEKEKMLDELERLIQTKALYLETKSKALELKENMIRSAIKSKENIKEEEKENVP